MDRFDVGPAVAARDIARPSSLSSATRCTLLMMVLDELSMNTVLSLMS